MSGPSLRLRGCGILLEKLLLSYGRRKTRVGKEARCATALVSHRGLLQFDQKAKIGMLFHLGRLLQCPVFEVCGLRGFRHHCHKV